MEAVLDVRCGYNNVSRHAPTWRPLPGQTLHRAALLGLWTTRTCVMVLPGSPPGTVDCSNEEMSRSLPRPMHNASFVLSIVPGSPPRTGLH
eukprot:1094106-Pelagomonas_calceolata.AAC.1